MFNDDHRSNFGNFPGNYDVINEIMCEIEIMCDLNYQQDFINYYQQDFKVFAIE